MRVAPKAAAGLGGAVAASLLLACNAIFGIRDLRFEDPEAGGGGASSGSGGSGGAPFCEDGDSLPCYEGPTALRGVGSCVEGAQICSDGAYGACLGSGSPSYDDCATPDDEDCDDTVLACTGDLLASRVVGGNNADGLDAVAVGTDGAVAITGQLVNAIDFDGINVVCNPNNGITDCAYVAKLDANLDTLWALKLGPCSTLDVSDLAVDDEGNVILVGSYMGTINLDGQLHFGGFGLSIVVAKLAAADGSVLWSRTFDGNEDQAATTVAVAGDRIYLGGLAEAPLDLGGGELAASNGPSPWLGVLDTMGNHVASLGLPANGTINDLAVKDGQVLAGGTLDQALDLTSLGGAMLPFQDAPDGFVIELEASTLGLAWAKSIAGVGDDLVDAVALGPVGDAFASIRTNGIVDLTGEPYVATASHDTLVARWAADRTLLFATPIAGAQPLGHHLAVGPGGSSLLLGTYENVLTLEDTILTATAARHAYAAKLSPSGGLVWLWSLAGSVSEGGDLWVGADDQVLLGQIFRGSVTAGANGWSTNGSDDALLVRLAP